jgi:hypothetical protein
MNWSRSAGEPQSAVARTFAVDQSMISRLAARAYERLCAFVGVTCKEEPA